MNIVKLNQNEISVVSGGFDGATIGTVVGGSIGAIVAASFISIQFAQQKTMRTITFGDKVRTVCGFKNAMMAVMFFVIIPIGNMVGSGIGYGVEWLWGIND